MLCGKNRSIRIGFVVLVLLSFLILACCNKKSVENKNLTTQEGTKQVTVTTEKQTEQAIYITIEKETSSTKENTVITTIINNGGDNEIIFDVTEEKENINVSSITTIPVTTDYITGEHTSQQNQTITEPATDFEGWVVKWY